MAKLRILRDVVVGVYGPGNRAAFTFEKAMEQMEHLQQDLATQAAWDLPGYPSNQLYFEAVPPAYQPQPASMRMSPPAGPIAYTSAPPLLPLAKTEPVAPPAKPAEEAAADPVEPKAPPRLSGLREGFSETD